VPLCSHYASRLASKDTDVQGEKLGFHPV